MLNYVYAELITDGPGYCLQTFNIIILKKTLCLEKINNFELHNKII